MAETEEEIAMNRQPLAPSLVQEFVTNAHGNLSRVKELLAQEPALVNATWDWGGGDFETALGAASHTGQKDIVRSLVKHGARLDIFAAAMLGKLEIVKAALAASPDAINTPGPHGIPLIAHALQGGDDAQSVLEYLQSL
jgi:ankyrin repeat protein